MGQFATAPLIHTYSPSMESASPRLAIKQDDTSIQIGAKQYQVKRYLTVQCLNKTLVTDEGGDFSPTIKPHFAIAPVNGAGTVYNQRCRMLLTDADGFIYHKMPLPVHAHDGLLSPCVTISLLKEQLIKAQQAEQTKFYTSYVIDDVNNQILATQHCLLNENDHRGLCHSLDQMANPTLEALAVNESPIKEALQHFNEPVLQRAELLFAAVGSNGLQQPPRGDLTNIGFLNNNFPTIEEDPQSPLYSPAK